MLGSIFFATLKAKISLIKEDVKPTKIIHGKAKAMFINI